MGSENPDWLPEGWAVDVKVRNYGRKDKYYIDPSNGLKFNSKTEVLRYLQNAAESNELKELNKNAGKKADEQELPPGWIKEVKTTKRGGKIRKDPVYTNPASGHQFQSIQEVLHYLETKNSEKTSSNSNDKDHISKKLEDNSQTSLAEAKNQTLVNTQADKKLPGQNGEYSEMELTGGSNSDIVNSVATPKQPVNRAERYSNRVQKRSRAGASNEADLWKETPAEQMQREDDSNVGEVPSKMQKPEGKEEGKGELPIKAHVGRKLENDIIIKQSLQSGSQNNIDTPEANGSEHREAENGYVGNAEQMQREDDSNVGDFPSKMQKLEGKEEGKNGIPIKVHVDRKLENDVIIKQSLQSGSTNNIDTPEADGSEHRDAESDFLGDSEKHEIIAARSNKRKKSANEWPRRTSKRLACVEVEPSPEAKPTNESHCFELKTEESNIQITLKLGELDLNRNEKFEECIEEAIEQPKNIVKENSTEKEPVSSSKILEFEGSAALESILMDPCIEFAFKTLTGEIPIEEVKKVVQNPLPSFSQTSMSSEASSSSSSVALPPPADIWSDPSFEFAVKMLTGEMPTEPTFRFNNSNHPSSLSYGGFDSGRKPFVSQQGVIPHGTSSGVYGHHQPSPWR